jgi:hypothetical protein
VINMDARWGALNHCPVLENHDTWRYIPIAQGILSWHKEFEISAAK